MADVLNTETPVVVATPAAGAALPREIVCGACGCKIARSGEILTTGDVYKKFLKHEQTLEAKDREISRLEGELAEAKRELETLKSSSGGARPTGHRPGSRVNT